MPIIAGKNLALRRKELSLTQEDVAARLGAPQSLISRWEHNERYPTEEQLGRLSVVLKCSREDLCADPKRPVYEVLSRLRLGLDEVRNLIPHLEAAYRDYDSSRRELRDQARRHEPSSPDANKPPQSRRRATRGSKSRRRPAS